MRGGMTMFWRVLLSEFSVQTDHEIGTRRPALMIIDKKNIKYQYQLIDVAIPEHGRGREREKGDEKV